MQFFCQELHSDIEKNSGEKFEDMFLVKIANKGTSLNSQKITGSRQNVVRSAMIGHNIACVKAAGRWQQTKCIDGSSGK